MTFDNEEELKKIHQYFPKAKLVLRIAVPDAKSAFPLEHKFGASPETVIPLLHILLELQLNLIGVSLHVGSNATCAQTYITAMQLALEVISTANQILGKPLELLDIGGGFPGLSTSMDLFQNIANCIKSVDIPSQITTISEPGRFFVSTCRSVYASIMGMRQVNGVIHYHINDGYYGNLGSDVGRFLVPIPVRKRKYKDNEVLDISSPEDQTEWKESKIWGPTCDSLDIIMNSCLLPELQIGDRICFRDVGAYSQVFSTEFCGYKNDRTLYFD